MNKTKDSIAFIGDLTVDTYPELGKTHLGGSSLNSAIWARRAGANNISIIAAVGSDTAGKQFIKKIEEEHITSTGIRRMEGRTSFIEIFIDPVTKERSWGGWNAGVLGEYHLGEHEFSFLRHQAIASLTVYGKTAHLLSELSLWGRTTTIRPMLMVDFDDLSQFDRSIDIITKHIAGFDAGFFGLSGVSDKDKIQELQRLAGDTGKLFIMTLGKEGAIAFDGNKKYIATTQQIDSGKIQDTTGAGDAFIAGFIVQYIKSHDILSSLEAGNHTAGEKIQKFGAN